MSKINFIFSILFSFFLISCDDSKVNRKDFFEIDKKEYLDKLEGFWLGQSIANWTGLITEMDKIGNIGQIKTGKFYTRHNWGGKDETNIWSSETSNNEINCFGLFLVESGHNLFPEPPAKIIGLNL